MRLLTQLLTVPMPNRALFPVVQGERKKNEKDLSYSGVSGTAHVSFPYWLILCRLVSIYIGKSYIVWWGVTWCHTYRHLSQMLPIQ